MKSVLSSTALGAMVAGGFAALCSAVFGVFHGLRALAVLVGMSDDAASAVAPLAELAIALGIFAALQDHIESRARGGAK